MRRRCLGFDVKSQTVLGSPRTVVLPEIFRTICSLQGPFAFFPYGQTASGEPRPQNPVVPRFSGFVADWPRPLARVPSPRSSQGLTRICDRRQRCRVHPDASRHAKREPTDTGLSPDRHVGCRSPSHRGARRGQAQLRRAPPRLRPRCVDQGRQCVRLCCVVGAYKTPTEIHREIQPPFTRSRDKTKNIETYPQKHSFANCALGGFSMIRSPRYVRSAMNTVKLDAPV